MSAPPPPPNKPKPPPPNKPKPPPPPGKPGSAPASPAPPSAGRHAPVPPPGGRPSPAPPPPRGPSAASPRPPPTPPQQPAPPQQQAEPYQPGGQPYQPGPPQPPVQPQPPQPPVQPPPPQPPVQPHHAAHASPGHAQPPPPPQDHYPYQQPQSQPQPPQQQAPYGQPQPPTQQPYGGYAAQQQQQQQQQQYGQQAPGQNGGHMYQKPQQPQLPYQQQQQTGNGAGPTSETSSPSGVVSPPALSPPRSSYESRGGVYQSTPPPSGVTMSPTSRARHSGSNARTLGAMHSVGSSASCISQDSGGDWGQRESEVMAPSAYTTTHENKRGSGGGYGPSAEPLAAAASSPPPAAGVDELAAANFGATARALAAMQNGEGFQIDAGMANKTWDQVAETNHSQPTRPRQQPQNRLNRGISTPHMISPRTFTTDDLPPPPPPDMIPPPPPPDDGMGVAPAPGHFGGNRFGAQPPQDPYPGQGTATAARYGGQPRPQGWSPAAPMPPGGHGPASHAAVPPPSESYPQGQPPPPSHPQPRHQQHGHHVAHASPGHAQPPPPQDHYPYQQPQSQPQPPQQQAPYGQPQPPTQQPFGGYAAQQQQQQQQQYGQQPMPPPAHERPSFNSQPGVSARVSFQENASAAYQAAGQGAAYPQQPYPQPQQPFPQHNGGGGFQGVAEHEAKPAAYADVMPAGTPAPPTFGSQAASPRAEMQRRLRRSMTTANLMPARSLMVQGLLDGDEDSPRGPMAPIPITGSDAHSHMITLNGEASSEDSTDLRDWIQSLDRCQWANYVSQSFKKKKLMSASTMSYHTKKLPKEPLHADTPADIHEAVLAVFYDIMVFCGDIKPRKTDPPGPIIQSRIVNTMLRDRRLGPDVVAFLLKQSHRNPSEECETRMWELMVSVLMVYEPPHPLMDHVCARVAQKRFRRDPIGGLAYAAWCVLANINAPAEGRRPQRHTEAPDQATIEAFKRNFIPGCIFGVNLEQVLRVEAFRKNAFARPHVSFVSMSIVPRLAKMLVEIVKLKGGLRMQMTELFTSVEVRRLQNMQEQVMAGDYAALMMTIEGGGMTEGFIDTAADAMRILMSWLSSLDPSPVPSGAYSACLQAGRTRQARDVVRSLEMMQPANQSLLCYIGSFLSELVKRGNENGATSETMAGMLTSCLICNPLKNDQVSAANAPLEQAYVQSLIEMCESGAIRIVEPTVRA